MKFRNLLTCTILLLLLGNVQFILAGNPLDKNEKVIVELTVDNFRELPRIEIDLNNEYGVGGGSLSSYPRVAKDGDIQSIHWSISPSKLRPNQVILDLELTISYVNRPEVKVEKKVLVTRSKIKEYQYKYGVKIKTYYESNRMAASNNSFNASANRVAFMRETMLLWRFTAPR